MFRLLLLVNRNKFKHTLSFLSDGIFLSGAGLSVVAGDWAPLAPLSVLVWDCLRRPSHRFL